MHIKIFTGTKLTSALQLYLNQPQPPLQIVHHLNNTYIGIYHDTKMPTISQIKELRDYIISLLQPHCTDLRCDNLPFVLFAQLFVG